jgi:hypothetical protein
VPELLAVIDRVRATIAACELALVEGAGGLLVPLTDCPRYDLARARAPASWSSSATDRRAQSRA